MCNKLYALNIGFRGALVLLVSCQLVLFIAILLIRVLLVIIPIVLKFLRIIMFMLMIFLKLFYRHIHNQPQLQILKLPLLTPLLIM